MIAIQASPIPEIPEAVSDFTKAILRKSDQKKNLDIRFSKRRNSEYEIAHPKQYVMGFSGWLTIDYAVKTIMLQIIKPNIAPLAKSDRDSERVIVKFTRQYLFQFDDEGNISLIKRDEAVLKRIWNNNRNILHSYKISLQLHQKIDKAYPQTVSEAPFNHEPILTHKGIKWETVQKAYKTDLLKSANRRSEVSLSALLNVCLDVAKALSIVHEEGVIHRDVKMENIFVEKCVERMRGRLADFGLACAVYDRDNMPKEYRYWDSLGEKAIFHPFTDIYALAITVAEVTWGPNMALLADVKNDLPNGFSIFITTHLQQSGLLPIDALLTSACRTTPMVNFHLTAYELIRQVFEEDSKLPNLYNNLLAEPLSYKQRLDRLAQQHISSHDFAQKLEALLHLLQLSEPKVKA